MDKRERTTKVRQIADLVEGYLGRLRRIVTFPDPDEDPVDTRQTVMALEDEIAYLADLAEALASRGTPTCRRHAQRAATAHTAAQALDTESLRSAP